jgi:two-component system sensor histidine kinase VicK
MEDLSKEMFAKPHATREELLLKLAELSDFVENAALPLHWVDGDGTIIWANQAELDSLGYTKEEYIGQPIKKFHADEEIINDILSRLIGNETLHNYSARLKCKDGQIKHVLINSNVLWQDGKFVHTRCFTRDITEIISQQEKKASLMARLEESEQRLRMAIESTKLGTWDHNLLTGDLNWSQECKKIYGLPDGTAVTFEGFNAQVYPPDKAYVTEQISRALDPRGGGNYDISYRILRLDDSVVRWIRAQGKAYFTADRKAERFIGTVLDITESRLAEERNARLAAIVKSSDDAITSKTLDGIVTSWNGAAQRIFGYTEDEMIGQPIFKLIPEDLRDEEQTILACLHNGAEHIETRRITKDQRVLDVALTISPVRDSDGNITGLSNITRDITERKQEEQRKDDFIGMVSHELKTPLTSLSALIQVSNAKLKNVGDTFLVSAMEKAAQQVKKMSAMINGFLNVSRFESGRIAIDKQVFDMRQLLIDIIGDTQVTVSTHSILMAAGDAIDVFADRDKIGSVISNLLSNAIKYSPRGKIIAVKCELQERHVQVSITDEGMGIKQQDMKHLFDRYYRVETSQTRLIAGFGIGLYICAEIIKQHQGKIWVDSVTGVGSTFHFLLPAATAP